MRVIYKVGLGLTAIMVVVVAGVIAALLYYHAHLTDIVVERFKQRTGLEIRPARAAIHFRSHLVIELDQPLVLDRTNQILQLNKFELLCSYNALLWRGGLPLYAIKLDKPRMRLPAPAQAVNISQLPHMDAEATRLLQFNIQRFSSVTRKVQVNDASVADSVGQPLFEHISVDAYRKRHGSLWRAKFSAVARSIPAGGARLAGDFSIGMAPSSASTPVARGIVWFWDAALRNEKVFGLNIDAGASGSVAATVLGNGGATADSQLKLTDVRFSGDQLYAPLVIKELAATTAIELTAQRLNLKKLTLQSGNSPVFQAEGSVWDPYSQKPDISLKIRNVEIDVPYVKALLRDVKNVPSWILDQAARVEKGKFKLAELALSGGLAELQAPQLPTIKKIDAQAFVEGADYRLPEQLKLRPMTGVAGSISIHEGIIQILQGHAQIGASEVSKFNLRLDVSSGIAKAAYTAHGEGSLDVGELYPVVLHEAGDLAPKIERNVQRLEGAATFQFEASGKLDGGEPLPAKYSLDLEARHVVVGLRGLPSEFTIVGGSVSLIPGEARIENLALAAARGTANVDGTLGVGKEIEPREIDIELHQLPAEEWLPLVLDTSSLAAKGPVGGTVSFAPGAKPESIPTVKGQLVLSPGEIQFGFLRNPIVVQAATLKLTGKGAELDMPGAKLEDQSIDLSVAVADFQNPDLNIDAVVSELDLEAMKFVRLPWSPKSEANFFGTTRASGHVEARRGHLGRLPMTDLKTDFVRSKSGWQLTNFVTHMFSGKLDAEIGGRDQDDWVHFKMHGAGIEAGPLLLLSGNQKSSPVTGTLYGDLDVWGDTNGNFFETLAGKGSAVMVDGTLNRFTLVARILDLMDLGQWLTAKFPDPRKITGVPFKTLSASFAGKQGAFYTNDFQLDGPILKFSAAGSIDIARSNLNLQVGVRPVLTVGRVVNQIPIVGPRLKKSGSGILQAYFDIWGPISDPKVMPAPITSIAEAVKRTLFLPINIIRPDTVR